MSISSLTFSTAALVVSLISFYFARKSWRESNRPLVVARIVTHSGGNVGTTLDLLVENTGNRPAKNIRLTVDPEALKTALAPNASDSHKKQVDNCFSERGII